MIDPADLAQARYGPELAKLTALLREAERDRDERRRQGSEPDPPVDPREE